MTGAAANSDASSSVLLKETDEGGNDHVNSNRRDNVNTVPDPGE